MTHRIRCCVPFCRRTIDPAKLEVGHTEWICEKHWRTVPRAIKQRRRQVKRRIAQLQRMWLSDQRGRKRWDEGARYTRYCWTITRAYQADHSVWDSCKAAAIEAAGGLR